MYYVKQIDDDSIILSNTLGIKLVTKDELKGMTEPIVGYNRLTGDLRVQSRNKLAEYYISREKLKGVATKVTKREYTDDIEEYEINGKIECIQTDNNTLKARITVDVPELEVATQVVFSYDNLFEQVITLGNELNIKEVNLMLEYDIFGEGISVLFYPFISVQSDLKVNICDVTFTDRTNFLGVYELYGMFKYESVQSVERKNIITKNKIDLSKLKFNQDTKLLDLFGDYVPDVEFPKDTTFKSIEKLFTVNLVTEMGTLRNIENISKSLQYEHKINYCNITCDCDIFEIMRFQHITMQASYRGDVIFEEDCDKITDTIGIIGNFRNARVVLEYSYIKFIKRLVNLPVYRNMMACLRQMISLQGFAEQFKDDLMKVNGYYPLMILSQINMCKKVLCDLGNTHILYELNDNCNSDEELFLSEIVYRLTD